MPWLRFSRTTSSPAPGFPVVAFFTVPVRVWAEAKAERSRTESSAIWIENALQGGRKARADTGSFDLAGTALCALFTALRVTEHEDCVRFAAFGMTGDGWVMISRFLVWTQPLLRGARFLPEAWLLRLVRKVSTTGSRRRVSCR